MPRPSEEFASVRMPAYLWSTAFELSIRASREPDSIDTTYDYLRILYYWYWSTGKIGHRNVLDFYQCAIYIATDTRDSQSQSQSHKSIPFMLRMVIVVEINSSTFNPLLFSSIYRHDVLPFGRFGPSTVDANLG